MTQNIQLQVTKNGWQESIGLFYKARPRSYLVSLEGAETSSGKGLDSMEVDPCVKMKSRSPWTTLSQLEYDESWRCHLGICPYHQGRFSIFRQSADLILWAHNVIELRPDQLQQPQITALLPCSGLKASQLHHLPLFLPWNSHQSRTGYIWPQTTGLSSIATESNLYGPSPRVLLLLFLNLFSPNV